MAIAMVLPARLRTCSAVDNDALCCRSRPSTRSSISSGLADPTVGELVTVIGRDGDEEIAVETVARQLGAPSAAYWMVGLKNVPYRYTSTTPQ